MPSDSEAPALAVTPAADEPDTMGRIERLAQKYLDALISVRAHVFVAGVALLLLRHQLGLDDATCTKITGLLITWITADTLRPTSPPQQG